MIRKALGLSFIPLAVSAQQNISIKGKLPELSSQIIYLENNQHFKQPVLVDNKGNFAISAKVDTGYYSIDKETYFYLSPPLSLEVSGTLQHLTFAGNGRAENIAFNRIRMITEKYFPMEGAHLHRKFNSMEPEQFLSTVAQFKEEASGVLAEGTLEKRFSRNQRENINYISRFFISDYIQRYGIEVEKEIEYFKIAEKLKPGTEIAETLLPAIKAMYSKKLSVDRTANLQELVWKDFDLNNSDLYSFSSYYRKLVLNRIESLRTAELAKYPYLKSKNANEVKRDIIIREFEDGPIKEDLLYQTTSYLLSGSSSDEKYVKDYLDQAKDSANRLAIQTKYEKLKLVTPGNESPLFFYKNQHNQTVSLSDLRGSYVYLQIWATWSNASLLELPYLRSAERKYQNQNVKFVTISVDLQAQKDKWLKTVKEQHPSGLHLLADKDCRSDFIKAYDISTFPRYLIIDPEGRIVSANAPRPSNPALQETLDKLLITNLSTCVSCAK